MPESVPAEWTAVFFDIGGVILAPDSVRRAHRTAVSAFADERGLEPEPALETWRETLGRYFRERGPRQFRRASEGYQRAFEAVDPDAEPADWRPLFEEATESVLEPVPGAVETVEALAEGDRYLAVISDIDASEGERILESFGIRSHFADVTTSEEVGWTKPHPAMFETAIEKAGVDPARALHVGDRYVNDMRGASRAGLWTVAHGGTAAEAVADADRDGYRVRADPHVDFHVDEPPGLLEVLGDERR